MWPQRVLGGGTVLCFDDRGGHMNTRMIKGHRTTDTHIRLHAKLMKSLSKIWNCTHDNFLALVLHYR